MSFALRIPQPQTRFARSGQAPQRLSPSLRSANQPTRPAATIPMQTAISVTISNPADSRAW